MANPETLATRLLIESTSLLQAHLSDAGFHIETGVAGMPTAFVASWGSGSPVIGILAEFDALPGITQDRTPEPTPLFEMRAGHACGHHLSMCRWWGIGIRRWTIAGGRGDS